MEEHGSWLLGLCGAEMVAWAGACEAGMVAGEEGRRGRGWQVINACCVQAAAARGKCQGGGGAEGTRMG